MTILFSFDFNVFFNKNLGQVATVVVGGGGIPNQGIYLIYIFSIAFKSQFYLFGSYLTRDTLIRLELEYRKL